MTDEELRQLIESNARAIQANTEQARLTDTRIEALAQQAQHTEANLDNLSTKLDRLSDIVTGNRQDIDTAERQLRASLDRLSDIVAGNRQDIDAAERQLRASIEDTVSMIADLAQQHQESDQRFTVFLEEARADRQRSRDRDAANEAEHRAFQQIIQTLLAEISRIWQRLAG